MECKLFTGLGSPADKCFIEWDASCIKGRNIAFVGCTVVGLPRRYFVAIKVFR